MTTHYTRRISFLCALSIAFSNVSTLALQATGPLTYAEIGNQLISASGAIEHTAKKPLTQEEKAQQEKDLTLDIVALSNVEKQRAVFSLPEPQIADETEDDKEYQYQAQRLLVSDLELYCSRNEQDRRNNLFSKIDMTQTVFGQRELAKLLAHPTTEINTLQARQTLVKELVENEPLFNELERLLDAVHKAESHIFSYWQTPNKATSELINSLYFGWLPESFNTYSCIHEAGVRLGNLGTAYQTVGDVITNAGMDYFLINTLQMQTFKAFNTIMHANSDTSFSSLLVNRAHNTFWPWGGFFRAKQLYSDTHKNFDLGFTTMSSPQAAAVASVMATMNTAGLGIKVWIIKNVLAQAKMTRNAANYLHNRLIGVATLVNTTNRIQHLCTKNPVFAKSLHNYSAMNTLRTHPTSNSTGFADLVKMLQTNTFKGSASFFSYTGRVLAAHKLMEKNKEDFNGFMQFIGEIDAYVSLARLYKKFQSQRVHYSFATYHTSSTPYINLTNFWNPMVNPNVVVPNDLELGAPGDKRNLIVSGANTGGKSTLLKAILTQMLFAQTIGIVAADNALITPCDYLAGSLNIIDNTGQGDSLYHAEVKRISMLIKAAERMAEENKPCFIIMDEMFRGTRPEKADLETYNCGKRLADMRNVSFILATHYLNNPLKLEAETNGICKNYKVDAYVDESGTIVRPYKLKPGVTTSTIASELLDNELNKH